MPTKKLSPGAALAAILTTAQAADELGVSVRRVQQYIDERRIPARQCECGQASLIRRADLDAVRGLKRGRPAKATAQ